MCDISEILYSLNFKLLVKNWKGYFAIVQKFLDPLKGQINIKRPITNLIVVIQDSFDTLLDTVSIEKCWNTICQAVSYGIKLINNILGL